MGDEVAVSRGIHDREMWVFKIAVELEEQLLVDRHREESAGTTVVEAEVADERARIERDLRSRDLRIWQQLFIQVDNILYSIHDRRKGRDQ